MSKKDESKLKGVNSEINNQSGSNDFLYFFIGILLLGAGLFMLTKRVMVQSSWYIWRIGSFDVSSGTVIIPLIIGMIWYFAKPKSVIAKVLIVLSIIFIVLSIIMSVKLHFVTTSMFDYILIFVMVSAGAGLLIRTLFRNKRN